MPLHFHSIKSPLCSGSRAEPSWGTRKINFYCSKGHGLVYDLFIFYIKFSAVCDFCIDSSSWNNYDLQFSFMKLLIWLVNHKSQVINSNFAVDQQRRQQALRFCSRWHYVGLGVGGSSERIGSTISRFLPNRPNFFGPKNHESHFF